MASPEDFVVSEAVRVAHLENGANGINGMLAVLFVIRNRADAGWGGGNWLNVLNDPNQFQAKGAIPDPSVDNTFLQVLQQADPIYRGETKDKLTEGALYFCIVNQVEKGSWFDREILQKPDKHPRVAQVGTSTFFK